MLPLSTTLKYYKRPEIQEALVTHAQDKEIGMCYQGESYGRRPDVLTYPREVLDLVLKGVTSFHASEELWENPLALGNQSKEDQQALRKGWDLVLDIDCKVFAYSKICAELILQFLQYCEVQDISIKFSGNKGFHIGLPFNAFPATIGNRRTKDLFPEAPRKIAAYVKENIKEELARKIMAYENGDITKVSANVQLPTNEIISYKTTSNGKVAQLHVEAFLEIDTILLASRHLYRMPYSFHEKSGLVSLPLLPTQLATFERAHAAPEHIGQPLTYLPRNTPESARRLLLQALDFEVKMPAQEISKKTFEDIPLTSPITEQFFPPCMQRICQGLEDGKKRGLFCLINFLGKVGWSKEQVEAYVYQWNKEKNREPLREVYIKGQLEHFVPGARLPPNCNNEAYYKGIGIACTPDDHCLRLKNPVNFTLSRWRRHIREKEEQDMKGKRRKKDTSQDPQEIK